MKLHCSIEPIVMESPTSKVVSAKAPKVVAPAPIAVSATDPEVVAMVTPTVAVSEGHDNEGYDTIY